MHLLSQANQREFHAVPTMVRFSLPWGEGRPEPSILIKAPALSQKYLLSQGRFDLFIFQIADGSLVYGVRIHDDPAHPMLVWSALAEQEEMDAICALTEPATLEVFLFDESVRCTAWAQVDIQIDAAALTAWGQRGVSTVARAEAPPIDQVRPAFRGLESNDPGPNGVLEHLRFKDGWTPGNNAYVTDSLRSSLISFAEDNEGQQQEELAVWLVDRLQPGGVVLNPQVETENGRRELCDLLMSHRHGAFLIESKSMSIFSRKALPDRARLTKDVKGHLSKAVRQLAGGLSSLRAGRTVLDGTGATELAVERQQTPHAIILVPDLSLLEETRDLGGDFLRQFAVENGACLQILDPTELFRMAQAAEIMQRKADASTLLELFDSHLFSRFERALQCRSPNFAFLLRTE